MLAIRLQRVGRKGYAQFRVVVQDVRQSPKSGKVVANLGSFNPHTKDSSVDTKKAEFYLTNGAKPSSRVALLLKELGVKLPNWVVEPTKKQKTIRNTEKLRKNRPAEPEVKEEAPAEITETAEATEEVVAEEVATEEAPKAEVEEPQAEVEAPEVVEEVAVEESPAEEAPETQK